MKILDMSAGYRHIWYDKKHPLVTFLDIRPEVKPDIVCDTRSIPLDAGSFDLIVFDPPHGTLSSSSRMGDTYGRFTAKEIYSTVAGSSIEAWRLAKPNAFMAFKWNDCQKRLENVLPMLRGWEPLFAHGLRMPGRQTTQTYWVMLRRLPMPPVPCV